MKTTFAALAALALLSGFAMADDAEAPRNCITNWEGGACGAPSNGTEQATTTTICKDGSVVRHRDSAPAGCPSCSKKS